MENSIISGIYCIYFNCDDAQYYIGQSVNIAKRFKEHCYALISNSHHNKKMQASYLRYGLPSEYVLEEATDVCLDAKEIYWINRFDSYRDGLNLTPGGMGTLKGAEHPSAYYTDEIYYKIMLELANTNKTAVQIADEMYVKLAVIKNLSCGNSHLNLAINYPEEHARMLSKNGSRHSGPHNGGMYKDVKSPTGEIYRGIVNATKFAKEHGLHQGHFAEVLIGKAKSHKGWTLA